MELTGSDPPCRAGLLFYQEQLWIVLCGPTAVDETVSSVGSPDCSVRITYRNLCKDACRHQQHSLPARWVTPFIPHCRVVVTTSVGSDHSTARRSSTVQWATDIAILGFSRYHDFKRCHPIWSNPSSAASVSSLGDIDAVLLMQRVALKFCCIRLHFTLAPSLADEGGVKGFRLDVWFLFLHASPTRILTPVWVNTETSWLPYIVHVQLIQFIKGYCYVWCLSIPTGKSIRKSIWTCMSCRSEHRSGFEWVRDPETRKSFALRCFKWNMSLSPVQRKLFDTNVKLHCVVHLMITRASFSLCWS